MASVTVNILKLQRSIRCLLITFVWLVVGRHRVLDYTHPGLDGHELITISNRLFLEELLIDTFVCNGRIYASFDILFHSRVLQSFRVALGLQVRVNIGSYGQTSTKILAKILSFSHICGQKHLYDILVSSNVVLELLKCDFLVIVCIGSLEELISLRLDLLHVWGGQGLQRVHR